MDRRNAATARAQRRSGRPAASLALVGALALAGAPSQAEDASLQPAGPTLTLAQAGSLPYAEPGVVCLPAAATSEDATQHLEIERGKSLFVRTEYTVRRVSVGDPETLDVVVLSPRELQFVAKKIGATNVVLWDPQGTPQAALDVHVGTPHSQVESEIQRVLGNPDVKVDSAGESIVLKGSVSNALAAEQAITVARGFFPDQAEKVINLLEVGGDQQVMLEVVVAEMARSLRREMGTNFRVFHMGNNHSVEIFNFLNNLSSLSSDPETLGSIFATDAINLIGSFTVGDDIYQFLFDVLHEKGLGKILAEPTLVARSGETASFLAGGEIPIPIAQGGAFGSITIEFKEFGVGVAFTPTVMSADRIHLKVAPEVSALDFTNAVTIGGSTVPAFNTRRASTAVELSDGQSFAIAGLLRDDVTELVDQYPVLGEIPILGMLFRSSQFQKNETELVMIVTPHLVKPLPPGDHQLPTDHFVEPNAFEFYLLGWLEGRMESAHQDSAQQTGGLIGDVGHTVAAAPEGESR